MREVKYRAWIESEKVLVDVLNINFKDKTVTLPIQTPVTTAYWWDESTYDLASVVLLQCTGLKDKNGVEIYEGDIVEVERMAGFDFRDNLLGEVIFREGCYWIDDDVQAEKLFDEVDELRVIGSIYENKELLEEK